MIVLHLYEFNLKKKKRRKENYFHNSFLVSVVDNLLKWKPNSLNFETLTWLKCLLKTNAKWQRSHVNPLKESLYLGFFFGLFGWFF